jgi:microcystin-dependent protein
MWIASGWHVHLRFHATCPTGRQPMKVETDVPIFVEGFPVGAVAAFLSSLAECPALPSNFELCDGHTCDNSASPFFGVVLPDLNGAVAGNNRFLRGAATSGAVGGADTHVLSVAEMPGHTHDIQVFGSTTPTVSCPAATLQKHTAVATSSTGGGTAHENRPAFYNVVWIIRVV